MKLVCSDAETYLDSRCCDVAAKSQSDVELLWKELKPYYFDCNDDLPRENAFRARLGLPAR